MGNKKLLIGIILFCLPFFVSAQPDNGKANSSVLEKANQIISLLQNKDKNAVLSQFRYTGFQEKKEFKYFLSKQKLEWAHVIITQFGIPPQNELSISEWKKISAGDSAKSSTISINITYYFKKADQTLSLTDDHISLNFHRIHDNDFVLDGLLFFGKDEYTKVLSLLEDTK